MKKNTPQSPSVQCYKGFSLIELIITIAIVAILATLAFPSYQSAMAERDRATAISDLNEIAQALERYYTFNRVYTEDFFDLSMSAAALLTLPSSDGLYNYIISGVAGDDQTYSIRAETTATNRDTYWLRLDQAGVRSNSINYGGTWLVDWP